MSTNLLVAVLVSFALAAAATPLVRAFARRIGAVAKPKSDRWHKAPTAMLGGVAIYVATMISTLALARHTADNWVVLAASSALFVVGLVDDFLHLKPYQKLIGQLLGASAVIYFGLVLPWTAWPVLNMLITFVWLIGVTNAVNMLDNMDGLAVGVAAIASACLAANFYFNHQPAEALMLAMFCAALAGFLIYNHNPASIFMGDCGSLFVGFFLASTALLSSHAGGGRSRSVVAVLAVPVLVLCIPIFDTTFVTLMRKMSGRSASQGGRDHTSHRLVALGLSERHAVWMLYGFAILGGILSLSVRRLSLDLSVASIAAFAIILGLVGVHLGRVRVYDPADVAAARQKPILAFLIDLSYKRRVFEVALDAALIIMANYWSYVLLFGPARSTSGDWQLFLKTIPALVFVKLAAFLVVGVYRGMWKYAGLSDVVLYAKAVAIGSVASLLLIVFAFRFDGFSRTVFVLDALLLLLLMTASRFAFRFLRNILPAPHARTGRRVLIYGAGDAGELLCRELTNNTTLGYVPAGFVDDDEMKSGRLIHGLRVHAGSDPLAETCRRTRADEVFLSTDTLSAARVREIVRQCESTGVPVKRMRITIERLADRELGWVLPSREATVPAAAIPPATADDKLLAGHSTPAVDH
ncbi:MAG TPA: hypothetical protein VF147_02870 [Vicinamibacterales bacterium]